MSEHTRRQVGRETCTPGSAA
ncbi:hypothetical protein PhCBS80983_g03386 [Powellomyces hirtus]|uniref:Uncharacterized protein n=1 Tax=Powellomyces hirtus TaxID=109895 RepID=A0A507E4N3_9FUNG|nr:hypothetical protein PhCBS80983_g03386 [Powellomyces hirtus]